MSVCAHACRCAILCSCVFVCVRTRGNIKLDVCMGVYVKYVIRRRLAGAVVDATPPHARKQSRDNPKYDPPPAGLKRKKPKGA